MLKKIKNALISVSDKENIIKVLRSLDKHNVKIISSGGTYKYIRKLGYNWVITDTTDNLPSSNSLISKGYKMFYPSNPWGNSNSIYWRKKL